MSPRLSYHLDLLRFIAAFIVLLSHFAYERFTQGYYAFIRDYNLGSDAVVVFFVLSGFVISFAAIEKDKTAGRFAFSRMTRLYSVAIPALILTLFCDKLGDWPFLRNGPEMIFVLVQMVLIGLSVMKRRIICFLQS